jgi:putative addiction module component (TIGR02574 family)
LSERERAHLAETLLRSLEPEQDEGVEEAWEAEIARRVEEIRSGTAQGRPAEDVFRDVRARYGW